MLTNDASVGDLNGDGEYEIILKWDPSNAKDNSQSGYTGEVGVEIFVPEGVAPALARSSRDATSNSCMAAKTSGEYTSISGCPR